MLYIHLVAQNIVALKKLGNCEGCNTLSDSEAISFSKNTGRQKLLKYSMTFTLDCD